MHCFQYSNGLRASGGNHSNDHSKHSHGLANEDCFIILNTNMQKKKKTPAHSCNSPCNHEAAAQCVRSHQFMFKVKIRI